MSPDELAAARRIVVYGYGREGRSLVPWLHEHTSAEVVVVQDDELAPDDRSALGDAGVQVVTGTPAVTELLGSGAYDLLLRSPGVSRYSAPIRAARDRGVPVTTATSLWLMQHRPDNVIAVTGTKGKSTTTTVLAHLLRAAGRDAVVAGNIGTAVLDLPEPPSAWDHVVVELSSYQLADLEGRLSVGVWLNLHREHLDWHGDEATYAADKGRIVACSDRLVANAADAQVAAACANHDDVRWFDATVDPLRADPVTVPRAAIEEALAGSSLVGRHHVANVTAAVTAALAAGVDVSGRLTSLAQVEPLPHRLQLVHDDGRRWVDDSIATIPEATVAALDAFVDEPVTLIAGGYERDQDHAPLVARLADTHDVTVVTLPDTGSRLRADLAAGAPGVPVHEADDLPEAVELAARLTPVGGVALLSPAAPSYGRFRSFEERGDRFRDLARAADPPAGASAAARPRSEP